MMLKAILWLLVSRQSANTYVVYGEKPGESKPIHTVNCTQSARLQRAYIETSSRGKKFLVFVDANSEIEGDCEISNKK